MTIGDRVKKCRIEKGLTQNELAAKLGYKSKSSVAHIENGRDIPRSMVVMLAEALNTTPTYLMGWDDSPDNNTAIDFVQLSGQEKELVDNFRLLNADGKETALAAVAGFATIDKYKKCDEISKLA